MGGLKKRIKHFLGWVIFRLGLHRWLLRDRDTIVLFHRVDDRHEANPISCTSAEFQAYCDFFGRYFPVVPLSRIVANVESGRVIGGALCITFDDGYRDNRSIAAPILDRVGLPACFFVATGLIESGTVAPWDEERDISSEWMSWDDVRELVSMGFEVGAHTENHVDLGLIRGDEAQGEITASREQLENELGIAIPWFSYPFGRAHQITPDNRKLVRELGFRCCLSAYGGSVRADSDPFELRRTPVSPWYHSPYHFGWELIFGNR